MITRAAYAVILSLSLFSAAGQAEQLTYTPRNPSFGGNPNNGPNLLGVASAINKFADPSSSSSLLPQLSPQQTEAQQFQQAITSSLIAGIGSQISNQIFGANSLNSGTYQLDNTKVTFSKANGTTTIDITDMSTGATSVISLPSY